VGRGPSIGDRLAPRRETEPSLQVIPRGTVWPKDLHAEQAAGLDDVAADLLLEGVDVGEAALLAQPVDELDAQAPAVDVLVEVEEVDLERERWTAAAAGLRDQRPEGRIEAQVRRAGEHRTGLRCLRLRLPPVAGEAGSSEEPRADGVDADRRQQLVGGADVAAGPPHLPAPA